ncbi:MAG: DUF418 domain-containing protein [Chitinophagaceae bacterium]
MSSPTEMRQALAAPVDQSERIIILDSLRGFAILGILLMNIPGFAMPNSAGDPSILNEFGTINFKVWHFVDWFPEGTQRAIFSMLFGAGIILFINGKEKRTGGMLPADYFFRRQLWLMVFSLIDVFILLWFGDILLDYACLGMVMFAFRNLSPKRLLIGASLCFLFSLARENADLYRDKVMIYKGEIAAAIDTTRTKLNDTQKDELGAMLDFKERSTHKSKLNRMEKVIRKTTGSYEELYQQRTDVYVNTLVRYLFFGVWDVLLFMFLGMAFFKMGILTGQAPVKTYWWMCIVGLGIGLTLSYLRLQPMIDTRFNWFEYTKKSSFDFYELSRTLRSIGILGLLMLLYKSGFFKWLFALMRPVGQMAFTNYLGQSLLCGLYFYGVGFGMFGKLERHEIYYVVLVVWSIEIIWSNIWLRYFRFGPLEWCWRSLTYWRKQPFRKQKSTATLVV